ncbi:hypothetical protein FA95DRAFT_1577096 [Auriscalpium vulgare]|uniref:Uncharacterized protein n=1 Tax=Auriscalpium vulgare TaxID=40419 RepID=A0ACB8R8K5_9AGAM|nr:hypothetical protein FA95DRAFT_1577096 [Auriscalpium vulgare]
MIRIFGCIRHAKSWISVTHVCARWRDIAYNNPDLWKDVSEEYCAPWLIDMITARARGERLLSVTIPIWPRVTDDPQSVKSKYLSGLLEQQLHRMQCLSLTASGHPSELCRSLFSAPSISLLELKVTTLFVFPWALAGTNFENLTALNIGHNGSKEATSSLVDIVTALQRMRNLTQLKLLDIDLDPLDILRDDHFATLPSLQCFTLSSTIWVAYELLCHLRIPSGTLADINVLHRGEDSQTIRTLFSQVHTSVLPSILHASPALRKLDESREMLVFTDTVVIHTSLGNDIPGKLSFRLERDRDLTDLSWRLPVYEAAMSLFASEGLQKLVTDAFSRRDWEDALGRLPDTRTIVVIGESSDELCMALLESMMVVTPSAQTESTRNAQGIPFPRLASLTLWSVNLETDIWTTEELPKSMGDILVEIIRMRKNAPVHLDDLILQECMIPDGFRERVQEADENIVRNIQNEIR